jgi:hypothetical protein
MQASALSFRLAVLFVLVGMTMGIAMAATHDHALRPAHAHINLLGWVSLFLFGIYYKLHPQLDTSRLARIQVAIWSVGTVALGASVAAIYLGYEAAEPAAAVSSFVVLGGMLLFGYLVFRPSLTQEPTVRLTPAE